MLDLERLSRELVATLRDKTDAPAALYKELESCLLEIETDRLKSHDAIEEARACYHDDDIQIPVVPLLSVASDATWVQAWVRVPEADDADERDES